MIFAEMKRTMKVTAISLFLCLLLVTSVGAAEFVAIGDDGVNLRSGPGTNYDIVYELPKGYPLQVVDRQGKWLKVVDYENDGGWIFASLVTNSAHVIVKVESANVRSGPGTQYSAIGTLSREVILKKLEKRGEWVKVSHPQLTGWVNQKLIWP